MANSGANIAHAMAKIPVIGAIAEVVTFREYQDSTNQMYADVKVPEVEVKNEDGTVNQDSTDAINQSIQEYTDEIIAQYQADVEEMCIRDSLRCQGETDGQRQPSLDQICLPGQKEMGPGEQEKHGEAPEQLVQGFQDSSES